MKEKKKGYMVDGVAQLKRNNNKYYASAFRYIYIYIFILDVCECVFDTN